MGQEKQDNVIVIVQVPLKQRIRKQPRIMPAMAFGGAVDEKCIDSLASFEDDSDDDCDEEEVVNVEAAMVSVADRTKPVCVCGLEMQKFQVQFAYGGGQTVQCNGCQKSVTGKEEIVYHCPAVSHLHRNGYDLCLECAEKQLRYDELRGLLE